MTEIRHPPITTPSPIASSLARKILGFGVWFAVGLAPFLGKMKVPGFTAVIGMYPEDLQNWLIPLSGLVMGMIAVIVEFAAGRRSSARKLGLWFRGSAVLFAAALVALMAAYVFWVVRLEKTIAGADGTPQSVSLAIVTGTPVVPVQYAGSLCKCNPGAPAEQCITDISTNPANVRTCFGAQRVAVTTLALAFVYLLVAGSFAAAIGVLLLSQRRR